jgi:hypothetical protein
MVPQRSQATRPRLVSWLRRRSQAHAPSGGRRAWPSGVAAARQRLTPPRGPTSTSARDLRWHPPVLAATGLSSFLPDRTPPQKRAERFGTPPRVRGLVSASPQYTASQPARTGAVTLPARCPRPGECMRRRGMLLPADPLDAVASRAGTFPSRAPSSGHSVRSHRAAACVGRHRAPRPPARRMRRYACPEHLSLALGAALPSPVTDAVMASPRPSRPHARAPSGRRSSRP